MEIPEEVIKKAEEKGINVTDLILMELSKKDPSEAIKIRLDLAKKYMAEAEEYLKKNDAVQASEKAYKVAEEVVKALSEKFNTQEYQQAVKEGRWYTYTLGESASILSEKLGDWVLEGWSNAYFLHVWGFHEGKLKVEYVSRYINPIKRMLEEAEKII